ncbi:MAG TPA: hypothetical protein PKW73_06280, partial [Candidatus Obscuribacter sp.]|nr:hypothetical protein [Candidatus Obscuribacter sp.]
YLTEKCLQIVIGGGVGEVAHEKLVIHIYYLMYFLPGSSKRSSADFCNSGPCIACTYGWDLRSILVLYPGLNRLCFSNRAQKFVQRNCKMRTWPSIQPFNDRTELHLFGKV